MRAILGFVFGLLGCGAVSAKEFFLKDGDRVLFLGDSITADGKFIAYIDGFLRTRFPDQNVHLMNLGLPSETVTGLSEPDHPWPRPNVHERIGRAVEKLTFNVAVVCYGMNDGIYYPFSEERFVAYQKGIRDLLGKLKPTGAKIVIMTPPAFDADSVEPENLLPEGAERYSWMKTFEGYNGVMQRYAEWLITLKDEVDMVIDLHTPTTAILKLRHDVEEGWKSGDGVHPTPSGHLPIAQAVLEAFGAPAEVSTHTVDLADAKSAADLQLELTSRVPIPADSTWDKKLLRMGCFNKKLNAHQLQVKGIENALYYVYEGEAVVGLVTGDELAAGVDLLSMEELSTNRVAREIYALVMKRHGMLGVSYREFVGHKRPGGKPKFLPMEEALQEATVLENKIRELAKPRRIVLSLRRTSD